MSKNPSVGLKVDVGLRAVGARHLDGGAPAAHSRAKRVVGHGVLHHFRHVGRRAVQIARVGVEIKPVRVVVHRVGAAQLLSLGVHGVHEHGNTDEAVAGKVGEFKDYIYNVQGAKIEYLGEDGTATPVVAGAKFASDLWISPNHGPVVEVAVTNSYDRFKDFGNGKYRITLMADGYKDVVLESSARFDLDSPLKMQGDDDDVNEITDGTDLVLNYDINNATYAESLVNAVANGTAKITIGEGRNTVAENGKVVVNGNVLTLTFENVKDSLVKDTQYTVTFPTLDYNDADKLGTDCFCSLCSLLTKQILLPLKQRTR